MSDSVDVQGLFSRRTPVGGVREVEVEVECAAWDIAMSAYGLIEVCSFRFYLSHL